MKKLILLTLVLLMGCGEAFAYCVYLSEENSRGYAHRCYDKEAICTYVESETHSGMVGGRSTIYSISCFPTPKSK